MKNLNKFIIINQRSEKVGPINIYEVFGPGEHLEIHVEPSSKFEFKSEIADSIDHVRERFARKIDQLGLGSHELQFYWFNKPSKDNNVDSGAEKKEPDTQAKE